MNNKILVSTGAYLGKVNNFDHSLIKKLSSRIYCDGYELMIYKMLYDDERSYSKTIVESGVNFHTVHLDKLLGDYLSRNKDGDKEFVLSCFEKNILLAKKIGVNKGVLHLWGGLPSDQNISVNIDFFDNLYNLAKSHSFLLMVENIPCNKSYNPFQHWETLYKEYGDKVRFTLDTRFIEFHGLWDYFYNADWLWQNNLIEHVHISDYKGNVNQWECLHKALPIGKGQIDFIRFLKHIVSKGYKNAITIECSARVDNRIDTDLLNHCIHYVRESIK